MAQILMLILVCFTCFGLSGCATGLVATGAGATAYVANQETPVTQQAKDLHIKTNIRDELLRQRFSYLKNLEVSVENGEVLLMGIVSTSFEKARIQDIALKQRFVRKVYDKVLVDNKYSIASYLNDSLIANMIRARMIISKDTYLSKLNVEVFKNKVYVFGTVANQKEKLVAEYLARTGKGVQSVYSFIRVTQ
jgi:osmotically-inducible protein OsmY